MAELNPLLYQQILKRNPAASFAEGEEMDEFATRVLAAVVEIGARHGGECVLIVTHGWTMDVVTREVSGLPRSAILRHKPKNGECVWLVATRESITPLPDGAPTHPFLLWPHRIDNFQKREPVEIRIPGANLPYAVFPHEYRRVRVAQEISRQVGELRDDTGGVDEYGGVDDDHYRPSMAW